MKKHIQLFSFLLLLTTVQRASAQCFQFTAEHVDLLSVTWSSESTQISLMASDDTHGNLYASNQCVVICPESMKFSLPSGTPLGNEGDPLWILPQNPYSNVPYVGVSAERVLSEVFGSAVTIQLTRLEGPGQLIVWQASSFGNIDVKMDSRDGIGAGDALTIPVGGHAHYNWGFTTNGIYRAYFRASGFRVGQTTGTISPETPFTFHILPLRPFESWTATHWPCECDTHIIGPSADPDGDRMINVIEYAFGNDPKVALYTNVPDVSFVTDGTTNYWAFRYVRATKATDITFSVEGASSIGGSSESLTNRIVVAPGGKSEIITVRDLSSKPTTSRFFKLKLELLYP